MQPVQQMIITQEGLQSLLDTLRRAGRRIIGPTQRDGAIVYDNIASISELPRGWSDAQDAGRYELLRREDDALFGYAVGPDSWKKYLHLPTLTLWRATREGDGVHLESEPEPKEKLAFIGVRACELHAIGVQDRVLLDGDYIDPHYRARRRDVFLVAVNCGQAGGTCFCASMGTGPRARDGFDVALTELLRDEHVFLIEAGTPAGENILAELPHRRASAREVDEANALIARTEAGMGREMPAVDLHALLVRNLQHPRWEAVADRCLSCANCTMVCPTCFCTSIEDSSDLAGLEPSRKRRWDSCFNLDFSYMHGGGARLSVASRYRQWMTHKLSTWFDQFGSSGCVGCGRCITWCPVGIDITEEARAISDSEKE